MTVVSIMRGENVPDAVRGAVGLAGGLGIKEGDTVVIKPNAKNQAPPGYGIVTDVAVIEPLVEMSMEKGAKRVKIADGAAYPSGSYHTFSAFETMGVTAMAKKMGPRSGGPEQLRQRRPRRPGWPRSGQCPRGKCGDPS